MQAKTSWGKSQRTRPNLWKLFLALLISFAVSVAQLFCLASPDDAFAAEQENNNGLAVTLTSNKDSYEKDETATLRLAIANSTQNEHNSVSYEIILPSGLSAKDEKALKGAFSSMPAGSEEVIEVEVSLSSSEAKQPTALPKTGDSPLVFGVAATMTVAAIACFAAIKARKRDRNLTSRTLTSLLLLSLLVVPGTFTTLAFGATASTEARAPASHTILFGGKEYEISSLVKSNPATNTEKEETTPPSTDEPSSEPTPPGIVYQNDVKFVEPVSWNGAHNEQEIEITVPSEYAESLKIGDKVVAKPSDEDYEGTCLVLTSVEQTEQGVVLKGTVPELDDIVKSIRDNGTSQEGIIVKPADDVEIETASGKMKRISAADRIEGDTVSFNIKKYGLKLSLSSALNYSIDYNAGHLKELKLVFELEEKVQAKFQAKETLEHELCTLYFPTNVPGLWVKADCSITISASGSISLSVSNVTSVGVERTEKTSFVFENEPSTDIALEAEVRTGLGVSGGITILGHLDMADVTLEAGVKFVSGSPEPRDNGMVCLDMKTSAYGALNGDFLNGSIGFNHDIANVDLDGLHFENGSLVGKCTWTNAPGTGEGGGVRPGPDNPGSENDKYGETPIFTAGGYGERLAEPFNINAGKTMQIGEVGASTTIGSSWWFINYECAPGTIMKLTYINADGSIASEDVSAFTSFGATNNRCAGEPLKIEVLAGRVTVTSLQAYSAPPCTAGTCEPADEPFRIDQKPVKLSPGETFQLTTVDDFEAILGKPAGQAVHWESSNESVATVEGSTGDNPGLVRALSAGTTTITAYLGDHWYTASFELTVS